MDKSFSTLSAAETPANAECVAFMSCRTEPKKPNDSRSTISPPEKSSVPETICTAAMTAEAATAP